MSVRKTGKKNTRIRLLYDAPVCLTFSLISISILLLDITAFNHKLVPAFFSAPGCQGSSSAFNWRAPSDYLKLIVHVFGHTSGNRLVTDITVILLLGPILEERFSTAIFILMMSFAALVTGVISACFIAAPLSGSSSIVFMMFFLTAAGTLSDKKLSLSLLVLGALYLGSIFFSPAGIIAVSAHMAGGLCGCMFCFLADPVQKKTAGTARKRKAVMQKSDEPL